MARRGELGEIEAEEGRELFLIAERGWRQGRVQEKHFLRKQLERKRKSGNTHKGLNKKGRKEKGEGLNTIKTL